MRVYEVMKRRRNLMEFFRDYCASDAEYLVYDDGYRRWPYSYRQMESAAQAFAGRLKEAGVCKSDRVLIWCENRPEWFAAFWGTLWREAIAVPLGAEWSLEFVRKVKKVVEPAAIFLGADVAWNTDGDPATDGPVWRPSAIEWAQSSRGEEIAQASRNDVAEIVFTSGSTGDPKGVQITHGNLLSQLEAVEPTLDMVREWLAPLITPRFLELLPLSHMFGQVTALGLPPLTRGSLEISRRRGAAATMETIRWRHISAAICVPAILESLRQQVLLESPERARAAADRDPLPERLWRYRRIHRRFGWRFLGFMVGGAPLDPALENFWSGAGYRIVQGYGLTETAPVVTLNDPLAPRRGSVGRPLAGEEVRIAEDGEVLVHGPNVMTGYYHDPDRTAEILRNGWLHTGDLGRLDREGYLYIEGRKKETIVTPEGQNIFPDDVERVLNRVPGVRESCVIGLPAGTGELGEWVHAVLVLEAGADEGEVAANANRQLETHQLIRGISVWPEGSLPRTPETGKLRRIEIRTRVREGLRGAPSRTGGDHPKCGPEAVAEEIQGRTGRRAVPESKLDDLGLGSIERVELLLALERRCGINIPETEFAASQTVGQLQTLVDRALSGHLSAAESGLNAFPAWNRNVLARAVRDVNLSLWILPFTRLLAKPQISGVERLLALTPPVIFAANHESHFDTPLILAALPPRWRYRIAPAMFKEYFAAHFHRREHPLLASAGADFAYYATALLFNGYPMPQQEAGVLDAVRYSGDLVSDGWSLLIYPEGERRPDRHMGAFQPGVGLLATRLHIPVVPIHLAGVDRVLARGEFLPHAGSTRVTFGEPVFPGSEKPERFAHRLEEVVQAL